jgi:hypothetical protein
LRPTVWRLMSARFELRAAPSLDKLYQSSCRPVEGRARLKVLPRRLRRARSPRRRRCKGRRLKSASGQRPAVPGRPVGGKESAQLARPIPRYATSASRRRRSVVARSATSPKGVRSLGGALVPPIVRPLRRASRPPSRVGGLRLSTSRQASQGLRVRARRRAVHAFALDQLAGLAPWKAMASREAATLNALTRHVTSIAHRSILSSQTAALAAIPSRVPPGGDTETETSN